MALSGKLVGGAQGAVRLGGGGIGMGSTLLEAHDAVSAKADKIGTNIRIRFILQLDHCLGTLELRVEPLLFRRTGDLCSTKSIFLSFRQRHCSPTCFNADPHPVPNGSGKKHPNQGCDQEPLAHHASFLDDAVALFIFGRSPGFPL